MLVKCPYNPLVCFSGDYPHSGPVSRYSIGKQRHRTLRILTCCEGDGFVALARAAQRHRARRGAELVVEARRASSQMHSTPWQLQSTHHLVPRTHPPTLTRIHRHANMRIAAPLSLSCSRFPSPPPTIRLSDARAGVGYLSTRARSRARLPLRRASAHAARSQGRPQHCQGRPRHCQGGILRSTCRRSCSTTRITKARSLASPTGRTSKNGRSWPCAPPTRRVQHDRRHILRPEHYTHLHPLLPPFTTRAVSLPSLKAGLHAMHARDAHCRC